MLLFGRRSKEFVTLSGYTLNKRSKREVNNRSFDYNRNVLIKQSNLLHAIPIVRTLINGTFYYE